MAKHAIVEANLLHNPAVDNHGRIGILVLARGGTCSLDGLDDLHRLTVVNDFTKNNVLAIEPVSFDSGDEKLRAIPGVKRVLGSDHCENGEEKLTCLVQRWPLREDLAWCA